MAEIKVYNLEGKETEILKLSDKVFAVPHKESVIKEVALAYLANRRGVYAHTKTKGEVRGGGKKPWKQKGTGRARHGSIRSPLWVGGGVTFGPRNTRNFEVKLNKKLKDRAFAMLLTDKLSSNHLIVVEDFEIKKPSAKTLFTLLKNLFKALSKDLRGKILVISNEDKNVKLSARNLQKVEFISWQNLNPLNLLSSNMVVFDADSVKKIEKRVLKNKVS